MADAREELVNTRGTGYFVLAEPGPMVNCTFTLLTQNTPSLLCSSCVPLDNIFAFT
jgi:hypothetical protein